ncbi:MAG: bifunctional (p)ppGpp synthetase/guanosine-3',5'-bis(diphosphate) 3'-pyrophosphohydrolase [Eubacteriales bacterium]|nr:bifunctional (p)ppGpp synthetase/guanosine-3',5'-bis(diphosphate) 3'-pyrophosphohydrolase [Eubacteriales bacterium]
MIENSEEKLHIDTEHERKVTAGMPGETREVREIREVTEAPVTASPALENFAISNSAEEIDGSDLKAEPRTLEATNVNATPEELWERLKKAYIAYRPASELPEIEKAYKLAYEAHINQKRKSGEPYIIHPLNTAIIITEIGMDKETVIGGLLHDVVEDTDVTLDYIRMEFGDDVALLVDGVTKLTELSFAVDKIEQQAENLRKMFISMAKDIRVVIIKLADRLHNLRTLQYQSAKKQYEKAKETLDIYAPLAERLGISKLKIELDDTALKYVMPDVYNDIAQQIILRREEREAIIAGIIREVQGHLKEAGIEASMSGRVKHFLSIYKKMVNQNKTIDQIYDLFAVRIMVDSVKDCYAALGVIHEMYKPIPGRFKDYIAMPKPNMYQSLHTTLIGKDGTPFEIQIRTYEMHRIAEYGIAAHWKYKETGGSNVKAESIDDEKMSWLRQVLEWQKDASDSKDFLNMIKSDFDILNDNVYCFTPSGDVKPLPLGSTPVDFAYSIHSAVGNQMVGARVNGRLVPIDYVLENGDQIEVITSQNSKGPSGDWLKFVKSTQAKNKINAWFKNVNREDNILKGKEQLERYCHAKGRQLKDLEKPEYIDAVLKRYAIKDWETVLASVGHGSLKEGQVVGKLIEARKKDERLNITDEDILENAELSSEAAPRRSKGSIAVRGVNDLSARCAHCCNPVPGDEIVGFVTRGRGITVHRTDCINMINLPPTEKNRIIEAEWDLGSESNDTYSAELRIYCTNRIGLMVDISRVFSEENIDITSINLKNSKSGTATLQITFDIHSKEELNKVSDKLRMLPEIIDITRAIG